MKSIYIKLTICMYWKRADGGEISDGVREILDESGTDRAIAMIGEGYTSGELNDNIRMHDDDPEDGIEYTGSWKTAYESGGTR